MRKYLHAYRFELLLFALLMVIFNKIFILNSDFYNVYIWPGNMFLLGLVSMAIFHENTLKIKVIKNILFLGILLIPFIAKIVFTNSILTFAGLITYLGFYSIIFFEVMRQIIKKSEITSSVVLGSLSGFLLMIILAAFSFLLIDFIDINSFKGMDGATVPQKYQQIIYFSTITLTTIGYGDITPATDSARLLAGFWGVMSQFYMVAVVGIIIAKFTSKQ